MIDRRHFSTNGPWLYDGTTAKTSDRFSVSGESICQISIGNENIFAWLCHSSLEKHLAESSLQVGGARDNNLAPREAKRNVGLARAPWSDRVKHAAFRRVFYTLGHLLPSHSRLRFATPVAKVMGVYFVDWKQPFK